MLGATSVPGVVYKSTLSRQHQKNLNREQGGQNCYSSTSSRSTMMNTSDYREESYMLLLELSSQEPTLQSCFKVIESTCLARGMGLKIRGRNVSADFQQFIDRYYLPFAEVAIRHFFTLGFVPWRLRKISTGDSVPEVIPLGMFTWSIDSIPDRISYASRRRSNVGAHFSLEQQVAEMAFQKQKQYFASSSKKDGGGGGGGKRYMPYTIPADRDTQGGKSTSPLIKKEEDLNDGEDGNKEGGNERLRNDASKKGHRCTPAFYRQQQALIRQHQLQGYHPLDDEDTKILRYQISFTESCGIMEEEVEIYEFMSPTNSVTRSSVLYGCVPSPLAHILVDYRNMRQAQMRLAHADAFNTQAKLICSYSTQRSMYALPEGNPILNTAGAGLLGGGGDAWGPQQRMGLNLDTNMPTEIESNAYTRDSLMETLVGVKPSDHKPLVYTLPKNTSLQQPPKLESIMDIGQMQAKFAHDICSLLGVPCGMIGGNGGGGNGVGSSSTSNKQGGGNNSKIFVTNMMTVCRHLKLLLTDVYLASFGGSAEDVEFSICAMPRMDINSVEEICQLLDSGMVSAENAMDISNMLFGLDLKQGVGKAANAGQFSKTFVTPKNKVDMVSAESDADAKKQQLAIMKQKQKSLPSRSS